jgi:hypothetical protein
MKLQKLLFLSFALPVVACDPVHIATTDLGDHIYLEYFEVNPAGVQEVYLTDSVNFKITLGKYDTEHEKIGGKIDGDSIIVFKNKAGNNRERVLVDQAKLSIDSLRKNKVTDKTPLFEFK